MFDEELEQIRKALGADSVQRLESIKSCNHDHCCEAWVYHGGNGSETHCQYRGKIEIKGHWYCLRHKPKI